MPGLKKSLVKSLSVCYITIVSVGVTTFTFPNQEWCIMSARDQCYTIAMVTPLLLSTPLSASILEHCYRLSKELIILEVLL